MNNEVYVINYQLIDTSDNYKEFDSLKEAQEFVKNIGEDMFVYIDLSTSIGSLAQSYSEVVNYEEV